MQAKNGQAGYLYEIPLLVMVIMAVLAIVLPLLPVVLRKVLAVAGCGAIVAGLYYMIVIPGWQPQARQLRRPWSIIVFLLIATAVVCGTAAYLLN